MTTPHLLPLNASKPEIAYATLARDIEDIDTPLRQLWKPYEIRADLLPWLAWTLSVDHWDDDWSEERKRAVVANSIAVHRKKGTLWAIKHNVEYVDGEVVRALVPPDKFYPAKTTTKAEREAWLSKMPEVRLFAFRDRSTWNYGAFLNSTYKSAPKAFLGLGASASPPGSGVASSATFFPAITDAATRIGRNAYIYREGVQVAKAGWRQRQADLEVIETPDEEIVRWPGERQSVFFAGDKPLARIVMQRSSAPSRYYTIALDRKGVRFDFHLHSIPGSLEPIDVRPDRVAQPGTARGQFIGKPLYGHWVESDAWLRLYDRFYLHDKNVLPRKKARLPHLGYFRLGMDPYHARLDILYTHTQPKRRFGRFVAGFFVANDPKRIEMLRRSVKWAKAARDKIWINARVHRLPRIGDPLTVGQLMVGQHIRDY